jgi:hydroxypyruvate reductase
VAADLDRARDIRVIAAGKAALGMAQAVDAALGARISAGIVTAPTASAAPVLGLDASGGIWRVFEADHPHPSAASEAAGRAALALADEARLRESLLLVCLSGGASAMLAVPAPGLSIADKSATTSTLLLAGLDIAETNVVRRHLSSIKGGQLAARAGRSITLAISDVCTPVDDDPVVIGSGPTVGDASTFADALGVIRRHGLASRLPGGVLAHLEAGAAGRTAGPVPPDDPRLRSAAYRIVASRHDAMRAAAATARALGYHVRVRSSATLGEARDAAARFLDAAGDLPRPGCIIASGETTVRVRGGGRGGRNQELALAAVERLAGLGPAALASIGTDGRDGPTDAAGAFVESGMWDEIGSSGRANLARALGENDSYPFLDSLDALIRTGPTGTNVGDLQILLTPSPQ